MRPLASAVVQYLSARGRLARRVDWLADAEANLPPVREAFERPWRAFARLTGETETPAPLSQAALLWLACHGLKPRRILQAGIGFHSYVLQLFAKGGAKARVETWGAAESERAPIEAFLGSEGLRRLRIVPSEENSPGRSSQTPSWGMIVVEPGAALQDWTMMENLVGGLRPSGVILAIDQDRGVTDRLLRRLRRQMRLEHFDLHPFITPGERASLRLIRGPSRRQ